MGWRRVSKSRPGRGRPEARQRGGLARADIWVTAMMRGRRRTCWSPRGNVTQLSMPCVTRLHCELSSERQLQRSVPGHLEATCID